MIKNYCIDLVVKMQHNNTLDVDAKLIFMASLVFEEAA